MNNSKQQKFQEPTRRITYAARGLLDWQLALNVAGAIIRICFSGGSMGSNGVVPARYTTENPAIQRIIEKTRYFEKGKIYIYRTVNLEKSEPQDNGSLPENSDQ